jgi:uncharacterized membrane protein YebE (DUF533 family)
MRFGSILGSLLGSLGGRALGSSLGGNSGGFIGSMAGSLLGSSAAGGLGGILKGILGGGNKNHQQERQQPAAQFNQSATDEVRSTLDDLDDDKAEALIKAMCCAAKSDGTVDDDEIRAIIGRLGEVDADEKAMLQRELSGPVDLAALLASVPKGFEQEVYAVSLLAIDVVSGPEASYLTELANGLGLSADATAQIKQSVGV